MLARWRPRGGSRASSAEPPAGRLRNKRGTTDSAGRGVHNHTRVMATRGVPTVASARTFAAQRIQLARSAVTVQRVLTRRPDIFLATWMEFESPDDTVSSRLSYSGRIDAVAERRDVARRAANAKHLPFSLPSSAQRHAVSGTTTQRLRHDFRHDAARARTNLTRRLTPTNARTHA